MDHLDTATNCLLPFQSTPANLLFQTDGEVSLPNGAVVTTSMGEQTEFDEPFMLHPDMMHDMAWTDGPEMHEPCSPDDTELLSWGMSNVPLTYATSNGGHSTGSSGNAVNSPTKSTNPSSKKNKAEERRERRRMQNRAAQRHFRDRRKVELKDNVQRIERMESEIKELSGENGKMEEMIQTLRKRCEGLERERKALRKEKRVLEGSAEAEEVGDVEAEAADEIEKLVRGVMGGNGDPHEDDCRWHWMKVKRRKVEEKGDWANVPSIFV